MNTSTSNRNDPKLARLRQLTPFATSTDAELDVVARLLTVQHVAAGSVLMHEGEFGHEVIVIASGSALVQSDGATIAELGAGDIAGELTLLEQGRRSATVTATSDMVVYVGTVVEFTEVLSAAPSVGRALLVIVARRMRAATERARGVPAGV